MARLSHKPDIVNKRVSVAQLLNEGVVLAPHEAVAIAQALIAGDGPAADAPHGAPTIETVELTATGDVVSPSESRPAVSEIAILLQAMLDGAPRVPGALRYAIARALLEVEGPPFDSIEEFSRALARHERGDRGAVVRGLLERGGYARVAAPAPLVFRLPRDVRSAGEDAASGVQAASSRPTVERRRRGPRVDELRRQLRAADARAYEQQAAAPTGRSAPEMRRSWRVPAAAAAAAAAALALAAGSYVARSYAGHRGAPPSTVSSQAAGEVRRVAEADRAVTPDQPPARPPERTAIAPSALKPFATRAASTVVAARAEARDVRYADEGALATTGTVSFAADSSSLRDQLRVMRIVDEGARSDHLAISPDGRSIAFDSDRDGQRAVYIASHDGSNIHRVSGPSSFAAMPAWAPDGKRIAFVHADAADPDVWNLALVTPDGGELRPLTRYESGRTWKASWFPDGQRLAFTRADRLVVLDVASGASREFATPVSGHPLRDPAVSPDGRRIIFQVVRNGAWLADAGDGSMQCVLTDPTAEQFTWSPDGRRVAYHSRRDNQWSIWVRAFD